MWGISMDTLDFLGRFFDLAFSLYRYEFVIGGYHFSAWGVMIFSGFAAIVLYFIKEFFG